MSAAAYFTSFVDIVLLRCVLIVSSPTVLVLVFLFIQVYLHLLLVWFDLYHLFVVGHHNRSVRMLFSFQLVHVFF